MKIDFLYSKFLEIKKISTDTRKNIKGSIFFCLRGPNYNGNNFAHKALENGAEIIITDEKQKKTEPKFILVENSLKCLQKLAEKHRETLNIPVLAITGTNGKTSTKNLIFEILNQKFNVKKTTGNLNNHIGVPLSILSIHKKHELAVLEFGASKLGDITELCNIGKPTHGLITNIGQAHLKEFKSVENIIATKTELWTYLTNKNGVIFFNLEDETLKKIFSQKSIYSNYKKIINYGISHNEVNFISADPFLKFTWKKELINTKIVGDYNLINIISAIAIGEYFSIKKNQIVKVLQNNVFKNNRSELIKTANNQIILDAYNSNPSSMKVSIKSFINIETSMEKTLIIGDMLELGEKSKNFHQELVEFINDKKIQNCITIGEIFHQTKSSFLQFKNKKLLEKFLIENPIQKNLILIKGSRKMKLETLQELL